jgi:hypothetical protein
LVGPIAIVTAQRPLRRPFLLRRCSGSDTHAHAFSDPNRDSYGDGNCNGNSDSAASIANPDGNCNGNTHGYSELHAQADSHAAVSTYAAAAPDAGTSTVMDSGLARESFCPNIHLSSGFGPRQRSCKYRRIFLPFHGSTA